MTAKISVRFVSTFGSLPNAQNKKWPFKLRHSVYLSVYLTVCTTLSLSLSLSLSFSLSLFPLSLFLPLFPRHLFAHTFTFYGLKGRNNGYRSMDRYNERNDTTNSRSNDMYNGRSFNLVATEANYICNIKQATARC